MPGIVGNPRMSKIRFQQTRMWRASRVCRREINFNKEVERRRVVHVGSPGVLDKMRLWIPALQILIGR